MALKLETWCARPAGCGVVVITTLAHTGKVIEVTFTIKPAIQAWSIYNKLVRFSW
jgi:hypothetical protein